MSGDTDWTLWYLGLTVAGTLAGGLLGASNGLFGMAIGGVFGGFFTLTMVLAADKPPEYGPHH